MIIFPQDILITFSKVDDRILKFVKKIRGLTQLPDCSMFHN